MTVAGGVRRSACVADDSNVVDCGVTTQSLACIFFSVCNLSAWESFIFFLTNCVHVTRCVLVTRYNWLMFAIDGEYCHLPEGVIVRDGYGVNSAASGLVYMGRWQNDKMNGEGRLCVEPVVPP